MEDEQQERQEELEAEAREAAARRRLTSESLIDVQLEEVDDEDEDDDEEDEQERGFERESDDDTPRGGGVNGGGVGLERNLSTGNSTEDGVAVSAASPATMARLRTASSSPELTQMASDSAALRNAQRRGVGRVVEAGSLIRNASSMARDDRRRHHGTVSDVTSVDALDDVVTMWRR